MTAGEIAAMFAHAWQTTTRHLQVLEAGGLISHERQGRMRIYRIEQCRLALVTDWLAHFQKPLKYSKGGTKDGQISNADGNRGTAAKTRIA
jgi:DNA-binding transcriptional ArsR family regulator